MNTNLIEIKASSFPLLVKEFANENFNLKILSAIQLMITSMALIAVLLLVKRGPLVVALEANGEIARVDTKTTDLQIEAATKRYLDERYSWNPTNIKTKLKTAELFVAPQLIPSFQKSMVSVVKYVEEKKVTQRIYPKSIKVDLKTQKIQIVADRFTEFDQLKAATELKLTLDFTTGAKTVQNPWGIYIAKETEEGPR